MKKSLKIGDLARQTGITVRTLHHYDQLGILRPSQRTSAGYRLYSEADIAKLQMIRSLQELGLSLQEIKTTLEKPQFSFEKVLEMHLQKLRQRITLEEAMVRNLEGVQRAFKNRKHYSLQDILITLKFMNDLKHQFGLNDEEQAALQKHWGQYSQDDIKAVEVEWPVLIAQVRSHMEKGTDPKDEAVQALAKRWMELVRMFSGGIQKVESHLKEKYEKGWEDMRQQHGEGVPDPAMMEYIQKALA